MDKALESLARRVESGEWAKVYIWVMVAGGPLAGELISESRYIQEWGERATLKVMDGETGEIAQRVSMSEQPSYYDPDPEPWKHLKLLSPIFLGPLGTIGFGLTRVRLDRVAAWGFVDGRQVQALTPKTTLSPGNV